VAEAGRRLAGLHVPAGRTFWGLRGEVTLEKQAPGAQFLRRPDVNFEVLREQFPQFRDLPRLAVRQIEIEAKYDGYIGREQEEIRRQRRMEQRPIPEGFNFSGVRGLSTEGREKLVRQAPLSLGQASRIPGVTPADIGVLMVALHADAGRAWDSEAHELS
jgi:tRNA uridine 5-carboxymethylaminomethyl modification enzyme